MHVDRPWGHVPSPPPFFHPRTARHGTARPALRGARSFVRSLALLSLSQLPISSAPAGVKPPSKPVPGQIRRPGDPRPCRTSPASPWSPPVPHVASPCPGVHARLHSCRLQVQLPPPFERRTTKPRPALTPRRVDPAGTRPDPKSSALLARLASWPSTADPACQALPRLGLSPK